MSDLSQRGWIKSPGYDLPLFILAPIAGLLIVAADAFPGGQRISILATFLVAIPHYMSSFTFYFGDDNLAYYKKRWVAFFLGPVLIFSTVAALRVLGIARPVLIAMFVWNVWHVSLQSGGILSIYRRLNGGPYAERRTAHLAILSVSATMAFWHVDRFQPLYEALLWIHPIAPWTIRTVTLPLAGVSVLLLIRQIASRPRPLSFAEGSFLVTSLVLFHPYLWVEDSNAATFAMLMGHFIQYLAIVWLLNHRKYAGASGTRHQRLLAWLSDNPRTVLLWIVVIGVGFYSADKLTQAAGIGMAYLITWNAMTLVHFYVDGLVWAFKQPYVRNSIGPYLTPEDHRVPS